MGTVRGVLGVGSNLCSVDEKDVRERDGETSDEGEEKTSVLVSHTVEHVVGEERSRSTKHVTKD